MPGKSAIQRAAEYSALVEDAITVEEVAVDNGRPVFEVECFGHSGRDHDVELAAKSMMMHAASDAVAIVRSEAGRYLAVLALCAETANERSVYQQALDYLHAASTPTGGQ